MNPHYVRLVRAVIRNLLIRGEVLVADRISIGAEEGVYVLRNKQGCAFYLDDPIYRFIEVTPQSELFRIVSRKCEWI